MGECVTNSHSDKSILPLRVLYSRVTSVHCQCHGYMLTDHTVSISVLRAFGQSAHFAKRAGDVAHLTALPSAYVKVV